jgi:hypothetical protein
MNDVSLEALQSVELGCRPRAEQRAGTCVNDGHPPASFLGERLPMGHHSTSDETPTSRADRPMDRRAGNAKACELRPTENSSLVLGNSLDVLMR